MYTQGFEITVTTTIPYRNDRNTATGTLVERNNEYIKLSQKGKILNIPRNIIEKVCLCNNKS